MTRYANVHEREPLTIGIDTIVAYLERQHMPRMAAFARDLQRLAESHAAERLRWQRDYEEVRARLDRYEPRRQTFIDRGHTWTGD
jgi:inhibitor of KinA sporulation pathway (predicted exonuclease)